MKRFIALLCSTITFFSLTSCSKSLDYLSQDIRNNVKDVNTDYIDLVVIEQTTWYVVVYDKLTMNMYLVVDGYQGSAMTPIYDIDGNIKKYESPVNE